jgi:repressor LexA
MGYKIEQARRARGWSQAELARRSGTTQQAIQRYESGEREPKVSAVVSMAAALGVTISYLLGLVGDDELLWLPGQGSNLRHAD